jgi:hypothetical protein
LHRPSGTQLPIDPKSSSDLWRNRQWLATGKPILGKVPPRDIVLVQEPAEQDHSSARAPRGEVDQSSLKVPQHHAAIGELLERLTSGERCGCSGGLIVRIQSDGVFIRQRLRLVIVTTGGGMTVAPGPERDVGSSTVQFAGSFGMAVT